MYEFVGTLSHGYSAYDSINDIVHCYIYPSEESLPCLTFLTADADGRTYFNYNKYESQFSNVFYSFGSLQASTMRRIVDVNKTSGCIHQWARVRNVHRVN